LDGLPSASCIPDIHTDLLVYIDGKLAGLSGWNQRDLAQKTRKARAKAVQIDKNLTQSRLRQGS
jgi:hypothetical protein